MEGEALVDKMAAAHMEVAHMGAGHRQAAHREVAVDFAHMGVVHRVLVHRVLVHMGVVHRVFVHMVRTGMELVTDKGAAHKGDIGIGLLMQRLGMAGFDSGSTDVMFADRNLLAVGKVVVDMDGSQVVAAVVYHMAKR